MAQAPKGQQRSPEVIDAAPKHEVPAKLDAKARRALLDEILRSGAANKSPGPGAARSQDFLYDEDGLPK